MIEAAVVISKDDEPIHWHHPEEATAGSIPDTRELWDVIWNNRNIVAGVAHTHPGTGRPWPSNTDLSTFMAIENALGRKLEWWILSDNAMVTVRIIKNDPQVPVISVDPVDEEPKWAKMLRMHSNWPEDGVAWMTCDDCDWVHILRENEVSVDVYRAHVKNDHENSGHPFWTEGK